MEATIHPLTGQPAESTKQPKDAPKATMHPLTGKPIAISEKGPSVGHRSPIDLSHYTKPLDYYRGYNVPITTGGVDWNEQAARNQSSTEQVWHGAVKAGATFLGAVTENTVGLLVGVPQAIAQGDVSKLYDNPIGRSIDAMNDSARERFPNLYTERQQSADFGFSWDSLGSTNFWADKALNGMAYFAGSLGTMWLTGGMGLGARSLTAATKAFQGLSKAKQMAQMGKVISSMTKTTKLADKILHSGKFAGLSVGKAKKLEMLRKAEMAFMMSGAEASVEAREIQKRLYSGKVEQWLEANPGKSEKDIPELDIKSFKDESTAGANWGYAANLAVLMPTNGATFMRGLGPGFRHSRKLKTKNVNFAGKAVKDAQGAIVKKEATTNLQRAAKFATRVKPYLAAHAREAFQEGAQYGIGEYQVQRRLNSEDFVTSFTEALSETLGSNGGRESIFLGALIGGMGKFGSRIAHGSETARRDKLLDTSIKDLGVFDNVMANIEVNEANSQIMELMELAQTVNDMEMFKDLQYTLISNNAARLADVGLFDTAMDFLEDQKSLSDEEFKKSFGYDTESELPESKTKIVADLQKRMKEDVELRQKVQDMMVNIVEPTGLPALLESEASKTERLKAQEAQRLYGNVMYNRLTRLKGHRQRVDNIKEEILQIVPDFNIDQAELELSLASEVSQEDKSKLKETKGESTGPKMKSLDQLVQELEKKGLVEEAEKLKGLKKGLLHNLKAITNTVESYNQLRRAPKDRIGFYQLMDAHEKEQKRIHSEAQEKQNREDAKNVIENSEIPADVETLPDDATIEEKKAAQKKKKELEREVEAARKKFSDLSDDLLFSMEGGEEMSSAEKLGLELAQKERTIKSHRTDQLSQLKENKQQDKEYGERQDELEEAFDPSNLGNVQYMDDTGTTFVVNGKTYYNHSENPLDALNRNEAGEIISVTLSTENGEQRTFQNEKTVDAIAFGLFVSVNSIQSETTREEREPIIDDIIKEDEEREASPIEKKIKDRTTEQLHAEVQDLNSDMGEVSALLADMHAEYRDLGFTQKDINSDPEIRSLKSIKGKIARRIKVRSKILRARLGKDSLSALSKSEEYKVEIEKRIEALKSERDQLDKKINQFAEFIKSEQYNESDAPYLQQQLNALRGQKGILTRKINKEIAKITPENEQAKTNDTSSSSTETVERPSERTEREDNEGKDPNSREQRETEELALDDDAAIVEEEDRKKTQSESEDALKKIGKDSKTETHTDPLINEEELELGDVNISLSVGEYSYGENGEYIITINDAGEIVRGELQDIKMSDGSILRFNRSLLNNSEVGEGTQVEFEILEGSEYYKNNTISHVNAPIAIKINGEYVALLAAEDSLSRHRIYDALTNTTKKVTAVVKAKLFNNDNITNVVDQDGNKVFFSIKDLIRSGAKIAILRSPVGAPMYWDSPNLTDEEQGALDAQLERTTQPEPGVVAIVVKDPNGKPTALYTSTQKLSKAAQTAVIEALKANDAETLTNIVGLNIIASVSPTAMYADTYQSGANALIFKVGGVNVRMSYNELSKALNGGVATYNFVTVDMEDGVTTFTPMSAEEKLKLYEQIKPKDIAKAFLEILPQKRFQVNVELLESTGTFINPVTGEKHASYEDYLDAEWEGLDARTEGSGHNSILTANFFKNGAAPFADVGLSFSDVKTSDGTIIMQESDEGPSGNEGNVLPGAPKSKKKSDRADTGKRRGRTKPTKPVSASKTSTTQKEPKAITVLRERSGNVKLVDETHYEATVDGKTHRLERVSSIVTPGGIPNPNAIVKSALTIGTKIDKVTRNFFNVAQSLFDEAGPLSVVKGLLADVELYHEYVGVKEESAKDKALREKKNEALAVSYTKMLTSLKQRFQLSGETVITDEITLWDINSGIAGTTDLITYDRRGALRIYDMKTMRGNQYTTHYNGHTKSKYETTEFGKSNAQKHKEQLSLYRMLVHSTTGALVEDIFIIPLPIQYEGGDTIASSVSGLAPKKIQALDNVLGHELSEYFISPTTAQAEETGESITREGNTITHTLTAADEKLIKESYKTLSEKEEKNNLRDLEDECPF